MSHSFEDNSELLKVGSNVGLSFDIPPVVDSPYGSANKLRGVIPFVLPYGKYVQPPILQDMERLKAFVHQKAIEYRDCFPNELDEEIRKKMMEFMICGVLVYPDGDITDERMKSYAILSILLYVLDDLVDNEETDISIEYSQMKGGLKLWDDVFLGVYERLEDVPCPIEAMAHLTRMFHDFFNQTAKEIKDFKTLHYAFREELKNTLAAIILSRDKVVEGQPKLSDHANKTMRGYIHGFNMVIEYIALHHNIVVSEEVRKDMLFRQMKESMNLASYAINDVYGIGRDIRLDEVKDSEILTNVVTNGVPLQTAFDNALASVNSNIQDFKITAKILREFYIDDPNISKYIRCMEYGIDGLLHGYLRTTRYGQTCAKIVPTF